MTYDELISLESVQQNEFSPGVVINDEGIARVIFSPHHFDNTGIVLPSAFDNVLSSLGMSVLRINYNFSNSLEITIKSLEKKSINKYVGYITAKVNDIRAIGCENYRVFYILDTATKDKIGHADIFSIRPNEKINLPPKSLKKYIRFEISKVFNKLKLKKIYNKL